MLSFYTAKQTCQHPCNDSCARLHARRPSARRRKTNMSIEKKCKIYLLNEHTCTAHSSVYIQLLSQSLSFNEGNGTITENINHRLEKNGEIGCLCKHIFILFILSRVFLKDIITKSWFLKSQLWKVPFAKINSKFLILNCSIAARFQFCIETQNSLTSL